MAAVHLVRGGRGVAHPGEGGGPEFGAVVLVERANFSVARARAKDEAARGYDGAAVILGPVLGTP